MKTRHQAFAVQSLHHRRLNHFRLLKSLWLSSCQLVDCPFQLILSKFSFVVFHDKAKRRQQENRLHDNPHLQHNQIQNFHDQSDDYLQNHQKKLFTTTALILFQTWWIYFSVSAQATFSGPAFSKMCGFTAGLAFCEDEDGFQWWWRWNGEGCHWCSYVNGGLKMSMLLLMESNDFYKIDDLIEGFKNINPSGPGCGLPL